MIDPEAKKRINSLLYDFKIDKRFWIYDNLTGEDYDKRRSKPAKYLDTTIKIVKKTNNTIDKQLFYFDICEREHQKDPKNWYWIWFIFNHYFNVKNPQKALEYGQEFLNVSKPYFDSFRILAFIRCSQLLFGLGDTQKGANYAFHAVSEAMNMGPEQMMQAFQYLLQLGIGMNNPNITIFASGFNPETLELPERIDAINKLYQSIL